MTGLPVTLSRNGLPVTLTDGGDVPRLVGASSGAGSALTGSTDETVLATVSIPAGYLGANGRIRLSLNVALSPSSANAKTIRVRLGGIGGTSVASAAYTTNTVGTMQVEISNQNDDAVQRTYGMANRTTDAVVAVLTPVGSTVDTSAAVDLVITGQLANGAESITLQSYAADVINGAQ